jgi:hypothetical protein
VCSSDLVHQHKSEAQWAKGTLVIHLGVATPEPDHDPLKVLEQSADFFRRRNMPQDEAETTGQAWRDECFHEWESGVREKHPTRSEVRMINEDGSFPKMIEEDLLPSYDQFKPCTFDAKERSGKREELSMGRRKS